MYHKLDDGRHEIIIRGWTATSGTLAEAIQQAQERRP
jgi:hypothetical protein